MMVDPSLEADRAYAYAFAWGLASAQPQAWSDADRAHAGRALVIAGAEQDPVSLLGGDSTARRALSLTAADEATRRAAQESLRWDVVRGVCDAAGVVELRGDDPTLDLAGLADGPRKFLAEVTGWLKDGGTELSGVAALDALGRLFGRSGVWARPSHLQTYASACVRIAHINAPTTPLASLAVQRLRADAVLPSKERISDSGYDLTLLYEKKRMGVVTMYGTGLVVDPPSGWYLDVVPRSSIIKRGYILANNVGIIDRSYRGEILVPLIKIDPGAPELELPARVAQLIPRPIVHFPVREEDRLSSTDRGAGGFGSTGS